MGFLSGIFRSRDKPTDSTVGSRYAFSMGGTPAGKSVTEKTAIELWGLNMKTEVEAKKNFIQQTVK